MDASLARSVLFTRTTSAREAWSSKKLPYMPDSKSSTNSVASKIPTTIAALMPVLSSASSTHEGDATPLGSITRCSGANWRTILSIVVMKSTLSVQHTQPLGSSTDSMPPAANISPSISAAPKSFTRTTVFSDPCFTKLLMNVVFPEPKSPQTTVVFTFDPHICNLTSVAYPLVQWRCRGNPGSDQAVLLAHPP